MDPYTILGINQSSTEQEIKTAYRKLAKEYHPDNNQGNKESEEKFKMMKAVRKKRIYQYFFY